MPGTSTYDAHFPPMVTQPTTLVGTQQQHTQEVNVNSHFLGIESLLQQIQQQQGLTNGQSYVVQQVQPNT